MKCTNCGTEFDEGIFCPECGTRFNVEHPKQLEEEKTRETKRIATEHELQMAREHAEQERIALERENAARIEKERQEQALAEQKKLEEEARKERIERAKIEAEGGGMAVVSLICGGFSIITCGILFVPEIIGIVTALLGKKQGKIRSDAKAGLGINIFALVLGILIIIVCVVHEGKEKSLSESVIETKSEDQVLMEESTTVETEDQPAAGNTQSVQPELSSNYEDVVDDDTYQKYIEWNGWYDGGWLDTTIIFFLNPEGEINGTCGYMRQNFRGMDWWYELEYFGDGRFVAKNQENESDVLYLMTKNATQKQIDFCYTMWDCDTTFTKGGDDVDILNYVQPSLTQYEEWCGEYEILKDGFDVSSGANVKCYEHIGIYDNYLGSLEISASVVDVGSGDVYVEYYGTLVPISDNIFQTEDGCFNIVFSSGELELESNYSDSLLEGIVLKAVY